MMIDFALKLTESSLTGLAAATDMLGPDDEGSSGESCAWKMWQAPNKIDAVASAADVVEGSYVSDEEPTCSPEEKETFHTTVHNKLDSSDANVAFQNLFTDVEIEREMGGQETRASVSIGDGTHDSKETTVWLAEADEECPWTAVDSSYLDDPAASAALTDLVVLKGWSTSLQQQATWDAPEVDVMVSAAKENGSVEISKNVGRKLMTATMDSQVPEQAVVMALDDTLSILPLTSTVCRKGHSDVVADGARVADVSEDGDIAPTLEGRMYYCQRDDTGMAKTLCRSCQHIGKDTQPDMILGMEPLDDAMKHKSATYRGGRTSNECEACHCTKRLSDQGALPMNHGASTVQTNGTPKRSSQAPLYSHEISQTPR